MTTFYRPANKQPKKNVWIERAKKKEPQFKTISIPLIRRVYPALIAAKLFSVTPLPGPTGLVYYLREVYGKKEEVCVKEEILPKLPVSSPSHPDSL